MARRGEIEIPIAVDTGGFEKGIRNGLIDPIEDAERALEELGKSDPGSELERDLKKAEDALDDIADTDVGRDLDREMKRAQDATEDLDDELDRARKGLDKLGYAARDAGDDGAKGMGKIKAGADEVTNEGFANAAEAVSSFRGDITDLGQIGQDTLGGLAGTLAGAGPAGIVGAIGLAAAAAGWGLITQNLEDQQEDADKLRERLAGAYQEAAEAGRDYLTVSQFIAESNDLMFNPDRAEEWKQLRSDAVVLQLDEGTIIKANLGDLTAQEVVRSQIAKKVQEARDADVELGDKLESGARKSALADIADRWSLITDETEKSADAARNAAKVTSDFLLDAAREAGTATSEVDKFGNELVRLPDGTEFVIDAKTQQAHQDMDRFYGDVDGKIDRLNKKDIDLRVGAKDQTGAVLGAIVGKINGTKAYITIGARAGAGIGGAIGTTIGRSQRG
ncbi:hypothetical protein [Microbacterium sp. T2.11-28]|uniref:hypothetical protein n=1 Tax=Microbacterium sp. T2.11-28 TaxID=3041169 RepID=UPI0024776623|nr:hypothetical protein [Microbacterium sp. T2.11-28]CAI9386089.1 hypothetical protein MICABA_00169 [Microbacterium sp. T2.11-28]